MKRSPWKKYMAGILAIGMLALQPGAAYAEETEVTASAGEYTQAFDENGIMQPISEQVQVMIAEGLVYMEPAAGYLYEVQSGKKVHPVTGNIIEDVCEVPESDEAEEAPESDETEEMAENAETEETAESDETEETAESAETEETAESSKTEEAPESKESAEETESKIEETGESKPEIEETEEALETEKPEEIEETEQTEQKPETVKAVDAFESFLTSAEFSKIQNRIQYNVTVPIEGLPSFITQEMVVGALKCQDEMGYPASVTIAQIIQESGFGSYGPGGDEKEGLSYLAFRYCNLFGIKGTGTAGSVDMNTLEMTGDGGLYPARAAFRAYHTYTEAIEDRGKLIKDYYSDLIQDVTDANTFAVRIGNRWATDIGYGKSLIRLMETYDLYRLDDLTLNDFSAMIGRFANPCPGAAITSTFGYRTFDNAFHKGLDLGTGSENIPTYAAESGTVIFAGYSSSAGNYIIIDHGDGLVTKYMHHAEIYVTEGQHVEKGQQIGLSGTTGDSTGNHLHFQVEENGVAIDPAIYLLDEGDGQVLAMRPAKKAAQVLMPMHFELSSLKLPEI